MAIQIGDIIRRRSKSRFGSLHVVTKIENDKWFTQIVKHHVTTRLGKTYIQECGYKEDVVDDIANYCIVVTSEEHRNRLDCL